MASPLSFAEGVQEQEVLVKALAAGIAEVTQTWKGPAPCVVQVNTLDPQREPTPQLGVSSLSAALNQTIELEVTLPNQRQLEEQLLRSRPPMVWFRLPALSLCSQLGNRALA